METGGTIQTALDGLSTSEIDHKRERRRERHLEASRLWKEKHRDRCREQQQRYREDQIQKRCKIDNKYREKIQLKELRINNPELYQEHIRKRNNIRIQEWRTRHPDRDKEKRKEYYRQRRIKALKKIADENYVCAHCGCPYEEVFTVGHFNGDGATHAKELGGRRTDSSRVIQWILKTPIEEVKKRVRLECVYCNYYHYYNGVYPPKDKLPKW